MSTRAAEMGSRLLRKQQGVVLFIALIALVTIMLAAVALTRSVDTSTVIAGNLAFKQAAAAAADTGVEQAIAWMAQINNANRAKDPSTDDTHAFNVTSAGRGYYATINPDPNFIRSDAAWTDNASQLVGTDGNGNTIRYIIERMCRDEDSLLNDTNCILSNAEDDNDSHKVGDARPVKNGKHPMVRVTVRVTGPRNTVSFTQAFVF
jgi:type IV pilus assembly protein PilX